MPIFAVVTKEDDKAAPAIKEAYPNGHKHVWPGLWFVVDEVTTQEVGNKLGISDGSRGGVFVCSLSTNYGGFGPKDAWEWLTLKGSPEK